MTVDTIARANQVLSLQGFSSRFHGCGAGVEPLCIGIQSLFCLWCGILYKRVLESAPPANVDSIIGGIP